MSTGGGLGSGGRISIARRRSDEEAWAILLQRRRPVGCCRAYRRVWHSRHAKSPRHPVPLPVQLPQNSPGRFFTWRQDSALRIAWLETQHTAVALADVAATVARPVQDLVRGHDREAVGARSYARPPPAVVTQIGRRRPAAAGGVVPPLVVAAGAADRRPRPIIIHIMGLGMAL